MHTKGPWVYDESENTVYSQDQEVTVVHMVQGSMCSPDALGNYDEGTANARLIAAAPDLLAACKAIVKVWEGPRERAALDFSKTMLDARAAIARAEGR
jgi:hypothetical protein